MDALTRHYVGQGDTRGQHFNPHVSALRFGARFFDHLKCVGPAVVSKDDARVFHGPALRSACTTSQRWVSVTAMPNTTCTVSVTPPRACANHGKMKVKPYRLTKYINAPKPAPARRDGKK